jgi:hypothetical protein
MQKNKILNTLRLKIRNKKNIHFFYTKKKGIIL